jgi:ABC-type uncharacterized transport system substrate-binding protein
MDFNDQLKQFCLNSLKGVFLFCVYCFVPFVVAAHPHVFMDTRVDFQFNEEGLDGFWVEWHFDEFFTSGILFDFDSDKDKKLSDQEVKEIEKGAFSNLKNFDYFTYAIAQGEKSAVKSVKHFQAEMKDGRLIYRFYVPHPLPNNGKRQQIKIAAYDESFYCDIAFQKRNAVTLLGAESYETSFRIQKNQEHTINYDNTYQTAVREGASYSGITNPYEIVLTFRSKK